MYQDNRVVIFFLFFYLTQMNQLINLILSFISYFQGSHKLFFNLVRGSNYPPDFFDFGGRGISPVARFEQNY